MTEDKSELIAPPARLECDICGREVYANRLCGREDCSRIGYLREHRRAESAERELESCRASLSTAEKENIRFAKEIEQLKANERYLLDQRGALEHKLANKSSASSALEKALGALRALLMKSYEAYCLVGEHATPEAEYDEYDTMMAPIWREAKAVLAAFSGGAHVDALKAQKEEEK